MEAPVSMWFYKESYWYKWQLQCPCGSIKNQTGTTKDSTVYVALQRIKLAPNKGNNKITELRTISQRDSQNS
jgi:hypothetical protein